MDVLATKENLRQIGERLNNRISDLQKSIYLTSVGTYLAVLASILAILAFIKNFI